MLSRATARAIILCRATAPNLRETENSQTLCGHNNVDDKTYTEYVFANEGSEVAEMTPPVDRKTVLIVGAGQAGGRAAQHLKALGFDGRIVMAGDEPHLPYERPPLSKAVLKGAAGEESLYLNPDADWKKDGLDVRLEDAVVGIDYANSRAVFASGDELVFDDLILATGGVARTLPVAGGELCISLRTLDDSRRLRSALERVERVVIIGGGVIGMEVASTAASLGKTVCVIEAGPRVMARVLPPPVSDWLEALHRGAGIELRMGAQVTAIRPHQGGYMVEGPGLSVQADLVLSAVGMVPNSGLVPPEARGKTGGILTDALGRVPGLTNVYACGDVAESWNALYQDHIRLETWRNADKQARAVAQTVLGQETPHTETPWMWTDQLERNIQVVGLWRSGGDIVARGEVGARGSSLFWLEDGMVRGGVLIDNGRDRRFLEKMVENGAAPDRGALADPSVPLKTIA